MSAARPGLRLLEGIGAALIASLAGAALLGALAPFVGQSAALRAAVATVTLGYALYLLARSGVRTGRVTTVAVWVAVSAGTWLGGLPLLAYVLLHIGLVWLVRSLYFYSGVLPALADFGLTLLATAFGAWAGSRSGSPFVAFWCFFLLQAFAAWLPPSVTPAVRLGEPTPPLEEQAFVRAHRAAVTALQRLAASS